MKLFLVSLLILAAPATQAATSLVLAERKDAAATKTQNYITDGFFVGGDKNIKSVALKEIRRSAANNKFERVVFDLDALPYFQVQASAEDGRYVISLWADVAHKLSASAIEKTFKKSKNIKKIQAMPQVEDGLTIFEVQLQNSTKRKNKLEVFFLAQPPRLILDII